MKKKYYILVLTFLSLFVGQSSYAFGDSESGDKGQEDSYSCTDEELEKAFKDVKYDLDDAVVINDYKDDVEKDPPVPVEEIEDPNPGEEDEDDTSASATTDPLKPDPELETWYLDNDGDGWHSETTESEKSPGTNWKKTTEGYDCDDSDSSKTNYCTTPCDKLKTQNNNTD